MFSRPTKARITPARFALSMKFGMRWQSVSTWMVRLAFSPSSSLSLISRSKKLSQSLLRARLSSVMKKALIPCARFSRMIAFEVVGGAKAALAPLHVDDRAEAALERAAAAEIEARPLAGIAVERLLRHPRHGDIGDARQVLEIIVDRLELVGPGIDEQAVEPPLLGLAGEDRAADVERFLDLRRNLVQHRQAARDMEAADHHRQPGRPELAGEIERMMKLVGLDADQPDQGAPAAPLQIARDPRRHDMLVALVDRDQVEIDIRPEHLPLRRVTGEAVQRGERIGGQDRPPPDDGVAVVVIMRRLDHHEMEVLAFLRHVASHSGSDNESHVLRGDWPEAAACPGGAKVEAHPLPLLLDINSI